MTLSKWKDRMPPWRVAGVMLLCAGIGGAAVGVSTWWQLRSELRARQDQLAESEEGRAREARASKALEQRKTELARDITQLTVDRDNLLVQAKNANEARDEAVGVRNLLERMLQKTGLENREMKERLEPAERDLETLRAEWHQVVGDRDRLEIEVDRYKTHSKEKKLETQMAALRSSERAAQDELRQAKRQYQKASKQEEKLSKHVKQLKQQLNELESEYTDQVKENRSLRHELIRLPKDVNRLAQQRERLRKELVDTHYNMGVLFAKRRDFVRALKEFQKVIELKPDDPDAHYNLGIIYAEHVPDRDKAIKFFRRYLQVAPQGQDASYAKKYIVTWRAWEAAERLD